MSAVSSGFNYVYFLQSEKEPLQVAIGLTPNLAYGLAQHNAGEIRSTARYRPWTIKLALAFRQPAKAELFEQYMRTAAGRAFAKRHF